MVPQLKTGLAVATLVVVTAPGIGERDREVSHAFALLRAIRTAEDLHFTNHGYYDTLQCLAADACVGPQQVASESYQGLLAADVAALKDYRGYTLRFYAGPRSSAPPTSALATPLTDYAMVLVPKGTSEPGRHSLCGDRTGLYISSGSRVPRVQEGRCQETSRRIQ